MRSIAQCWNATGTQAPFTLALSGRTYDHVRNHHSHRRMGRSDGLLRHRLRRGTTGGLNMFATAQSNRGFFTTFANGWAVSVQWDAGHMCANRWQKSPEHACRNAEVAVIDPDGAFSAGFPGAGNDSIAGYLSPDAVAQVIAWASSRAPEARAIKPVWATEEVEG
jgi:hypothetical protein